MPIITPDYYRVLCEAVEEVAADFADTKGFAYMAPEIKDRLAAAAVSILRATGAEVDVEDE